MPFKDREYRKQYNRELVTQRRAEWFRGKACEECGSTAGLELDHRDPKTKVDHRIWTWSPDRREAELQKCRALCKPCHRKKTDTEQRKGTELPNSKLTDDLIRQIRASDKPYRVLAEQYGVYYTTIGKIKRREDWKHVP